jgi:hypothetical protein
MAKMAFDTIFTEHSDGSLEPRQRIRVGGVEIRPGIRFSKGAAFGGVDFAQFAGNDFEVETDGDVLVIKGIYGRN